ncbi:hypothetical protein Q4F19_09415 [Sphingomonas sp. BIUV-7]|uniref:Uncharacterized protein n=1 Tax=Sphingomonas natans TaxID=3063330 RepID=A0ABT8Y9T7_9SPHN|nr:hypothetical protein [Sphingomonas sp. BIUV-7]MDO6414598.1 hypothetical protein [Sphingomonas sp. BIUV-7]
MAHLAEVNAEMLETMLIDMLVGATGGKNAKWKRAVGMIEILPITSHVTSNWRVIAIGTPDEKAAVEEAAEIVREHHPYAVA